MPHNYHPQCECCHASVPIEELIICSVCEAPVCRNCAKGDVCIDCYYEEVDQARVLPYMEWLL